MKYISKDNLTTYDTLIKDYIKNKAQNLLEIFAYGVLFNVNVADPHLTRIGNMSLHKSLPILSELKGCVALGGKVIYWLHPDDWRFRKDTAGFILQDLTLSVTDDTYSITNDVFGTLLYDLQYIKIGEIVCKVISIDTANKVATVSPESTLEAGTYDVELGAVLNGYDGTVRVYCPEFYIKSESDGDYRRVWLSTIKIDGTWTKQEALLLDAYRSTVLSSVPSGMGYLSTLPANSAISVVNTNTYCRGGGNRSANDAYLNTDMFRTDLGKPRTNISRATMRTYSRNANSQMLSYDQYKNIFYWLYVVEYANFNSQETYNATLTSEGYRQGGMENGIAIMGNWGEYNNYYPLTPCGYGNTLGNSTGLVSLTIPEFTYTWYNYYLSQYADTSSCVNYNGSNNSKVITKVINTSYALYQNALCVFDTVKYKVTGLTDGLSVIFKEGNNFSTATVLGELTEDGEIEIAWGKYNTNGMKWISFGIVLDSCNIQIQILTRPSTLVPKTAQTMKMARWRGFDNPFGDIWTNLDGIIIDADAYNHPNNMNYVYTCLDSSKFADSLNNSYIKVGEEIHQEGWTKVFDLGDAAHIIPHVMGGNTTQYICDYHWVGGKDKNLRTLLVGGYADHGAAAGLGYFYSAGGVGAVWADVGFRSVSGVVFLV